MAAAAAVALAGAAGGQQAVPAAPGAPGAPADPPAPQADVTSSLMAEVEADPPADSGEYEPHALRAVSMFAIPPSESRMFHEHDLIQIIVRETSTALASHELDLDKKTKVKVNVNQWPNFQLADLLQFVIPPSDTAGLAKVDLTTQNKFEGDGEYERRDDFTARLTAEVVEILPNGSLVIESRTRIRMDEEETVLNVTGICRPEDITPANTVLSSQLHDLSVRKLNKGELKKTNEKGLFSKILDLMFAF